MLRALITASTLALTIAGQTPGQPAKAAAPGPAQTHQKLLNRYCVACHNDQVKTAGIAITSLKTTAIPADAAPWEKVLRKVRTGEMPPVGAPQPDKAAALSLSTWLEGELDRNGAAQPNPGAPAIHRLNRAEYSNAVRDLLALDLDNAASLPADDSGYGFDNIGSVLTVSPLHMEKYMSTARRVSRLAMGNVKSKPAIEKYSPTAATNGETGGELPLTVRGGIVVRPYFPVEAEYSIMVRVRGNPSSALPPPKLDLRVDGKRIQLLDVAINAAEEAQISRNVEIRVPLKPGKHTIGAGLLPELAKVEGGAVARGPLAPPPSSPASVDYVLIGGPFDPKGPGNSESRARVLTCRPGPSLPEATCAQRIINTLARRAYRRPVTLADTAPLMKVFAMGRKDGNSFEAGIETALRAILVSPHFLFRVEKSPANSTPGSRHRISDLELASRLSFFIWSSIPDDELLHLAAQNRLRPVLATQVKRMLADPKSRALVENFAGQWLQLRNVANWRPDPDKFPKFDEPLRFALQRETELFVEHIVREDRNVLEFLNADYSFLNERLANHYGVPGVKGSYFRRVPLNGEERGGVLTHGSVLLVSSYPTRTSPVLRGKWVLENILASPPPPPPPNVPDLKASAANSAKDLRKALEEHRANIACAACHSRLDPLGFALENFDAVGTYRKTEDGAEVDSSGALPGGATFRGPSGLKQVLMERSDQFVDCISEKLLTYALGRGLEHYDLPTVRSIRRDTAKNGYQFSSLALAIANSVPFQMRRTPDR
jgi:mono/diheme cytochrome c family protein